MTSLICLRSNYDCMQKLYNYILKWQITFAKAVTWFTYGIAVMIHTEGIISFISFFCH